jgi:hypothetical protein
MPSSILDILKVSLSCLMLLVLFTFGGKKFYVEQLPVRKLSLKFDELLNKVILLPFLLLLILQICLTKLVEEQLAL